MRFPLETARAVRAVWPAELQDPGVFTCGGRIRNWDHDPEFLDGDFCDLKDVNLGSGGVDDFRPSAALEVLAIIAYRQPVTRGGIEAIRGVNSDNAVATLLQRELIEEVGRANGPGRPALFGTTTRFLEHFGLSSHEELPAIEFPAEALPEVTSEGQAASES